jgi:hypothetical protein
MGAPNPYDKAIVGWHRQYVGSEYSESNITFERRLWDHLSLGLLSAIISHIWEQRVNIISVPRQRPARRVWDEVD